ncbi:hypothetical protein [Thermophagus xiamenensis]|uniref:Uncharacterized protein n=1 Tax=Thermophagus xiamenensis TaxID=385682 RepID=A0A1I1XI48_9BACT|nr:hypothetical protein [Thermophagus xiamenensis]SFE06871.1 hypothetical protein SAMN05444380_10647 [Thermophagus xiamenensis]
MRLNLYLLFFYSFGQLGFSQAYQINDLTSLYDQFMFEKTNMNDIDSRYMQIEGTPYLYDEFIKGEVILNDTVQLKDIPLRYDIYRDRIQFISKKNLILEVNPSTVLSAKIDEHKFIISNYLDDSEEKRGVLELLVDGKVRLYRKYQVAFMKATKVIGYKDPAPDRFERKDDIFLIAIGPGYPEVIIGKKEFFEKLKTIKPDIEQYAKRHKLKARYGKGMVKLVEVCNE